MEEKKATEPGYNNDGTRGVRMPDSSPGMPPGSVRSVPIGQEIPPVPKTGGAPVQFRVLARWETAAPVRLAGGPEVPELTGQFYVLRLRGLPPMPPPADNEAILASIKAGSRLERNGEPAIHCAHLFYGVAKTVHRCPPLLSSRHRPYRGHREGRHARMSLLPLPPFRSSSR